MPLKFAVSGSTGLIGSYLCQWLLDHDQKVSRLTRPTTFHHLSGDAIAWDYQKSRIDLEKLEGHDVVVHLAGANIADRAWTPAYKKEIFESRVHGTAFLAEALTKLQKPPKVFFSGSAIGYYGDQPFGTCLDEGSANGYGFLAEVTKEWEEATRPAENFGIRVIHMRMGMVLAKTGGALAKMLPPFYWGLGGPIGSGRQAMSWIALEEIPQIIFFLAQSDQVKGPVNFTAPGVVTSKEFAKALGQVIHRPAVFPLPAFMVKTIFGQMGEELLLSGSHVLPRRLLDLHYQFAYPDLKSALKSII